MSRQSHGPSPHPVLVPLLWAALLLAVLVVLAVLLPTHTAAAAGAHEGERGASGQGWSLPEQQRSSLAERHGSSVADRHAPSMVDRHGSPQAGRHLWSLPDRIELPDGFQPEGIAVVGPFAFLGSRADGDLYRANLLTGRGEVFSQGPGTPSLGMKVGPLGRLWVAGGSRGDARVVDTRTGRVLASWHLSEQPSFVNDVVLTGRAAWFTDSLRAQLYRVPLWGGQSAEAVTVPLGGDWEQPQPGEFGANGIATTPDRRALLVVSSTSGELFRVDPRTGDATLVDLGGASLARGDGLLREGRTLYVVQNALDVVTVLHLDRTGTSARVVDSLTSGDFDFPTTVARFAGSLYLPNARFSTTPEPGTEYWVTRVPLGR